jgi:hypothetical protein
LVDRRHSSGNQFHRFLMQAIQTRNDQFEGIGSCIEEEVAGRGMRRRRRRRRERVVCFHASI